MDEKQAVDAGARGEREAFETIKTAVRELAALIPEPDDAQTADWPCLNSADRECLQKAYVTLRSALSEPSFDAGAHQDAQEFAALQSWLWKNARAIRPAGKVGLAGWALAALADTEAAAAGEPVTVDKWLHVDDVKGLCRDFSSRTGSVYIKDVESALDGLEAFYTAPPAASGRKLTDERIAEVSAEVTAQMLAEAPGFRIVSSEEFDLRFARAILRASDSDTASNNT